MPGTRFTPMACTATREVVLLPMMRIARTLGPMKVIPAWAQASANSSCSERNP